jgi:ketosteroid isomerase-like protein
MSQENVEILREAIEAINAGDLDAAIDGVHPDIEWQTLDLFPDSATYRGPEAVKGFFQTWLDTFEGFRLHLGECVPVGEHLILATLRVRGKGVGSGAGVESPEFFQLFEFRDGQVIRTQMFQTEKEALEAAGRRSSGGEMP